MTHGVEDPNAGHLVYLSQSQQRSASLRTATHNGNNQDLQHTPGHVSQSRRTAYALQKRSPLTLLTPPNRVEEQCSLNSYESQEEVSSLPTATLSVDDRHSRGMWYRPVRNASSSFTSWSLTPYTTYVYIR